MRLWRRVPGWHQGAAAAGRRCRTQRPAVPSAADSRTRFFPAAGLGARLASPLWKMPRHRSGPRPCLSGPTQGSGGRPRGCYRLSLT